MTLQWTSQNIRTRLQNKKYPNFSNPVVRMLSMNAQLPFLMQPFQRFILGTAHLDTRQMMTELLRGDASVFTTQVELVFAQSVPNDWDPVHQRRLQVSSATPLIQLSQNSAENEEITSLTAKTGQNKSKKAVSEDATLQPFPSVTLRTCLFAGFYLSVAPFLITFLGRFWSEL